MTAPRLTDAALSRFQLDLSRLTTTVQRAADLVVRDVAFDVVENIVVGGAVSPGTPVDTGFARNSWVVGLNAPGTPRQPDTPPADGAPPVGDPVGEAAPALAGVTAGDTVYLTSNTAYMPILEDGGSQAQAPQGMVRLTLAGAQTLVDAAVARVNAAGGR